MKVVILAGGRGTRISEESYLKPKPMIEIGGLPILWHIMKYYSSFGYHEFIICCGYKGHVIKEYFADYYLHRSDVTFDFSAENRMTVHQNVAEPWRVTLVDTGLYTQTGGRIQRVQKYIGDESFMLTYGDGVSNTDLSALLMQHRASGKTVTLTAVQPGGRFGALDLSGEMITGFREKSREDGGWVNGGFMVAEPEIFTYLNGDASVFERDHWNALHKVDGWEHTGIMDFGNVWTLNVTKQSWRNYGKLVQRHGGCGKMLDFYRNKRVLVTGHTGFKGTWLCTILRLAGAEVTGFSLAAAAPSLFEITGQRTKMHSVEGDIRDFEALWKFFSDTKPEIVFHLAAQPIVREGYRDPVGTYGTNIMGTVNLLECIRRFGGVRSFVNVTTDKVYQNNDWPWGYRETDRLNGFDPYSNSKSCSKLVTDSYRNCFLSQCGTAVSVVRAGNVIGGGDFAADRIIPDCIRAIQQNEAIKVRNPFSIRPYQHVLEALSAYLMIAQRQYEDSQFCGSYNVGPENSNCLTTGALVELFCRIWGENARWECVESIGPHEDNYLRLDCSKIIAILGWHPKWDVEKAVSSTVDWTKEWISGYDAAACMEQQIIHYFETIKG